LRLTPKLRGMPLGLLASLIALTAAAWALTLYQTFSMEMPMGVAVRGGMEGMDGVAGMATAGIPTGARGRPRSARPDIMTGIVIDRLQVARRAAPAKPSSNSFRQAPA
jgi:predicted metal-binding membrane protein